MSVFLRYNNTAYARVLCSGHRHGKSPFDASHLPFQREFANQRIRFQKVRHELTACDEYPNRHRKIKGSGLFGQFSRGQVDDRSIVRTRETAIDDSSFNTMSAFADRLLGQPDQNRFRERSRRQIDLDIDRKGFNSQQRVRFQFRKHFEPLSRDIYTKSHINFSIS